MAPCHNHPLRHRQRALSRGRRTAVWALITIASLLGLLVILATWINRQMFDNSTWNKASTQLIQDPSVQTALSAYLVNSLYDNVDVPAAIAQRLPPGLKPLAVPAAAALRQPATDGVKLLLTRPRVQKLWVDSNALTHQRLIAVLENKTRDGVDTGNGKVTIDLGALLASIGPQLGLPAAAVAQIPPNTGVITVMRSDQLGMVAEGGQGHTGHQRVGVHPRARDVRGRAVPRRRRTTQDAPKHRLGVHLRWGCSSSSSAGSAATTPSTR